MDTVATKEPKNKLIDVAKIKRLCEERNLSFAELGRRIGLLNRDLISRRLQNSYAILGDEVFLIADQLGVSADDLRLS
ncbi:MAG: helix-turn-helix transcriptional regulator [Ignavibacteriales bacterium]|nr:helix-turn-helix transcriptional regulator [Ignavibacteriales bacterium]